MATFGWPCVFTGLTIGLGVEAKKALIDGLTWHVRPVGPTAWAVWSGDMHLPAAVLASAEQAVTWARRSAEPVRHGRVLVHDENAAISEEIPLGEYPHLPD